VLLPAGSTIDGRIAVYCVSHAEANSPIVIVVAFTAAHYQPLFHGFYWAKREAEVHKCYAIVLISMLFAGLTAKVARETSAPVITKLNSTPLAFTQSSGQGDAQVLFRASEGGATLRFTKEGVTYQFTRRIDKSGAVLTTGAGQPPARKKPASR